MFQPSTLHTDFARQLGEDRLAAVRVERRPRRTGRPSFAARLVTAVVRAAHRPAARPVGEPERPVRASA